AEAFIKKGVPVVASVKYAKGALSGAAVSSSAGHLLVIVGVQKDGKVIVNDPAAAGNSTVRRVYQRAQFERAWLSGSGGVSYIIRPTSKALPVDTARW
ncbi:MAG: C39 family peptidase, partial [Aeromicrobium sp.]